jgi:hypothetical protein
MIIIKSRRAAFSINVNVSMQARLPVPRRSGLTGREKQVVAKLKYKFSLVRAVCTFKES